MLLDCFPQAAAAAKISSSSTEANAHWMHSCCCCCCLFELKVSGLVCAISLTWVPVHALMHAYMHVWINKYMHTCMHTCTCSGILQEWMYGTCLPWVCTWRVRACVRACMYYVCCWVHLNQLQAGHESVHRKSLKCKLIFLKINKYFILLFVYFLAFLLKSILSKLKLFF